MGINAVKGVEIGAGFRAAALSGEENGDEIRIGPDGQPVFLSNNAGGILGDLDRQPPGLFRRQADLLDGRRAVVDRFERDRDQHSAPPRSFASAFKGEVGSMRARRPLSGQRGRRRNPAMALHTAGRSLSDGRFERCSGAGGGGGAYAKGEIVVVSDDDDRENEGDLFVAAALCTPEKMAFIIRTTSASRAARAGEPSGCISILRRSTTRRWDGLHGLGRRALRPDHRHLGRGAATRCARLPIRNNGAADFVRPTSLPAGGQGRWRADAPATPRPASTSAASPAWRRSAFWPSRTTTAPGGGWRDRIRCASPACNA